MHPTVPGIDFGRCDCMASFSRPSFLIGSPSPEVEDLVKINASIPWPARIFRPCD